MKIPAAVLLLALSCLLSSPALSEWQFGERIAVTGPATTGLYHHLDGAGRKHIALAGEVVAVTWEDNRDGSPQVYVVRLAADRRLFEQPIRLSEGAEAYEPSIAALDDDRFVIAWEQDGGVYLRLLVRGRPGPLLSLEAASAGHATLAVHGADIYAAWRVRRGGAWYLRVARLLVEAGDQARIDSVVDVENEGLATPLLLPTLAARAATVCIAWEDRRAGHTRMLTSYSTDRGRSFATPVDLNEYYSGRNAYDKGNGVTRVSMAAFGSDELVAAWMDKRRGGGYGIFAALAAENGASFGPNERVHGAEGDRLPHYNPATAGNPGGQFVVAWDDYRGGDLDVWLSSYNDDLEWGADRSPAPASGTGEQSHPALVLAENGDLHLLWVERDDVNAPSRLWYARGRYNE